jgi:hypothetical protein
VRFFVLAGAGYEGCSKLVGRSEAWLRFWLILAEEKDPRHGLETAVAKSRCDKSEDLEAPDLLG